LIRKISGSLGVCVEWTVVAWEGPARGSAGWLWDRRLEVVRGRRFKKLASVARLEGKGGFGGIGTGRNNISINHSDIFPCGKCTTREVQNDILKQNKARV
jgi:hypothetical protein